MTQPRLFYSRFLFVLCLLFATPLTALADESEGPKPGSEAEALSLLETAEESLEDKAPETVTPDGPSTEPLSEPSIEPPPPLSQEDKEGLAEIARSLPLHGILPLKIPDWDGENDSWLRLGSRLIRHFSPKSLSRKAQLQLLTERPLSPIIQELVPKHPRYLALMNWLRERALSAGKEAPQIRKPPYQVRYGLTAKEVGELRTRLEYESYISNEVTGRLRNYFDKALRNALQEWQLDHGLPKTSSLDPLTLQELNAPLSPYISDAILALKRFRQLDYRDVGGIQLLVHINNYELQAEEDGKITLQMPVAVGKNTEDDQTPMLSAPLYAIVVNPSWHVPTRLVNTRLRPSVNDDPEALEAKGYHVRVDAESGQWRVRQGPGPQNPLGRLKFLLKDTQGIYLHDTVVQGTFAKDTRTVSAGCVRLAEPETLAYYLLSARKDELEKALTEDPERSVYFKTPPYDTHLMYQTMLIADGQRKRFPDIYQLDLMDSAIASMDDQDLLIEAIKALEPPLPTEYPALESLD